MSNISSHIALLKKTGILLAILAVGTQLWAQTPSNAGTGQDPFGQLDRALSRAADDLLTAVAQRPAAAPGIGAIAGQGPEAMVALNISRHAGSGERGLQRVAQLRPLIEPILREEGVPPELAAVVLIESGGQPTTLSPKGARGIWQFMPDTARRYGLTVRPGQDERLDVQKSTRAAARYLRDLHARFGDWPLALAAYNAGVEAVNTAVTKANHGDFARVSYSLPLETRNYVPAVLEAMGQLSNLRPRQLLARSTARVLYAAATSD